MKWVVVLSVFFVSLAVVEELQAEDPSRAEILVVEGMKQLEVGAFDQALANFQSAIGLNGDLVAAYVGMGHVYLKQGNLDEAEKAFKKAVAKNKKYAPAFNGLGLVYAQKKNELRRAIAYFRDANRADQSYSEAQYNLAKTLEQFGSSETLKEYRHVLVIDPKHFDALYRIGRLYDRDGELEKAVQVYQDQLVSNPDHQGARLNLGIDLKQLGKTEEAVSVLAQVASKPGEFQRRGVLELAQVFQKRRDFDKSNQLFEAYLNQLPEDEQTLYYDLRFVARDKELDDFKGATALEDKKKQFFAFWERLDPAPVTEANERMLEYFRRVAFAREHFGAYKQPWDTRGEAYIRYGDPDHISRSGNINIERHPQVVAVKNRLIAQAGEAAIALAQQRADAVAHQMREPGSSVNEDDRATQVVQTDDNFMGWPVYPVPVDGRWEYWIYADVGGGLEVTFVQNNFPGPYVYADVPMGMSNSAQIWQDMNPQIVLQRVSERRPTLYHPDFATGPLDFYFATAAFRGQNGQTALDVYYGIPTSDLAFVAGGDGQQIALLDRGVAVYDGTGNLVHRMSEEMALQSSVQPDQGTLIPETDQLALLPGSYRIVVQVLDRTSGKSQVYQQNREVPEFVEDDKLKISDVALAASIDVANKKRFQKGNISVVPMASQAYLPAQPVFVYFELYNLKRDAFGQTRYRISYQVQSIEKKGVGARILGGLGKLVGQTSGESSIAIEYEQVGKISQEQGFLELDLSSTEPGKQHLTIRVTDENTGQTAGVATTFTIQ